MKLWTDMTALTQLQELLTRDTDSLSQEEKSLLVDFYDRAASPKRMPFTTTYLAELLAKPRRELASAQRADLLAFRAVMNLKLHGLLSASHQIRESRVA